MKSLLIIFLFIVANSSIAQYKTIGQIERYDSAITKIISWDARPEIIAEGFDWSEGALWVEQYKMLLWSDVPQNLVYKWTEAKGTEIYLHRAGYTDTIKRGGEMGSNGLLLDKNNNLFLCQHGNRQVARMHAPLDMPLSIYVPLANNYQGKKFSSPNDATFNAKGELFFTDPPYGLEKQANDPKKETPYNGVYKVKQNGKVILLLDSITRPNGIAFFPGEKQLLIANSDGAKPNWYIYNVKGDSLSNGRIFYSNINRDRKLKGLPDGLKIDSKGNVFATGPGGVFVFNRNGTLLGKIAVPEATSNCSLSADEKTLYITNDMYVLRLKMRN